VAWRPHFERPRSQFPPVILAEDLTGQGHVTRVVGDQPRFYAIIPLV